MASKDQIFEYRFNKGLDLSVDPKQATGLLDIENGGLSEFGSITKRDGLEAMDATLASAGDTVVILNEVNGSSSEKIVPVDNIVAVDNISSQLALVGYRSSRNGTSYSEDTNVLATYTPASDTWKTRGPISSYKLENEKLIPHNVYSYCEHAYCTDENNIEYVGFVETGSATSAYLTVKVKNGSYVAQRVKLYCSDSVTGLGSKCRIYGIGSGTAGAKFVVVSAGASTGTWYVQWVEFLLSSFTYGYYAPGSKAVWSTGSDYANGNIFLGSCKYTHLTYGECIAVAYANSAKTNIDVTAFKADRTEIATLDNVTSAAATTQIMDIDLCNFTNAGGDSLIGVTILRTDTTAVVPHPIVWFRAFSEDVVASAAAQTVDMGHPDNNHSYYYGTVSTYQSPYSSDSSGSVIIVASAIPEYEEVFQSANVCSSASGADYSHASKTVVYEACVDGTPAMAPLTSGPPTCNFALASKIVEYNGKIWALLHSGIIGHTELESSYTKEGVLELGEKQPTMYLCSLSRWTNTFATYQYYWNVEVVVFPRTSTYHGVYKPLGSIIVDGDELSFISMKQNYRSNENKAFSPMITRVDMLSSCANNQSVYSSDSKLYAGAVPSCYDGDYISECNFLHSPQIAMGSSADNAGSGILFDKIYRYVAIVEIYNANGEVERSYTSNDHLVDNHDYNPTGAANQIHTINITTSVFGSYDKLKNKNMLIKLFRTVSTAHGSGFTPDAPFYLVGSIANSMLDSDGIVQITDMLSDSVILSSEVLYTDGGVLLDNNPPPLDMIVGHGQRLFGVNQYDRNEIWYTKQKQVGYGWQWSDYLTMRVDDESEITGLASVSGRLVVFTAKNIYDMYGDGPNALGEGVFSPPSRVSTSIGCIGPNTIKECELGIVFQSEFGIYILDKGLNLNYISEPVKDYESNTVNSIQVLTGLKQVRFIQTARTLVWDYSKNLWSTFTGLYNGTSSTEYGGKGVVLRNTGANKGLFIENSSNNHHDQSYNGAVIYSLKIATPWFAPNTLQNESRIHSVNILGDAVSLVHGVKVEFYRNFDNTAFETHYLQEGNFSMPIRITPTQQRLTALRVGISDYSVATASTMSEVFNLSSILLEYVPRAINRIWKKGGMSSTYVAPAAKGLWACYYEKAFSLVGSTKTSYTLPTGEDQYAIYGDTTSRCWFGGDPSFPTRKILSGVLHNTGTTSKWMVDIAGYKVTSLPVMYACGYDSTWAGAPGSQNGTVWLYDHAGDSWNSIKSESNYTFQAIHAGSGPNVFVCGVNFTAGGEYHCVLEYFNGSSWTDYTASLAGITGVQHSTWAPKGDMDSGLWGIWKSPSGYIYCSGGMLFDDPASANYDAEPIIITNKTGSFARQITGQAAFAGRYIYFEKMDGIADDDFYCIAQDDDLSEDTIWHFNGTTWTEIYKQSTGGILAAAADFRDLYATSTDLYVCGSGRTGAGLDNGIIIKYNYLTATWSVIEEDASVYYINGIWYVE